MPAVHPSDSASASVASVRPHGAFPSSLHGTEHVARGKNTTSIPESGHPPFMPSAKLHSASRHGGGALVFLQSSEGNENQSRLEMAVVVLHDSSQNCAVVRGTHMVIHSYVCRSRRSSEEAWKSHGIRGNGKFSGDKSEMERGKRVGDRRQTGDERHR